MNPMSLPIALHILAAVIWVGGMFFAYVVLRPVAGALLQPPQRLPLWAACFDRFFLWVWLAVLILPLTGYWIIFAVLGGMQSVGLYVHVMNGTALVMIGLFLLIYFVYYRGLKRAVAAADWPTGRHHLERIRTLVGVNLVLGLLTVVVATGGRYLS